MTGNLDILSVVNILHFTLLRRGLNRTFFVLMMTYSKLQYKCWWLSYFRNICLECLHRYRTVKCYHFLSNVKVRQTVIEGNLSFSIYHKGMQEMTSARRKTTFKIFSAMKKFEFLTLQDWAGIQINFMKGNKNCIILRYIIS